jgi:hypothetical protein
MAFTNSHCRATSFSNSREPFVEEPLATDGEDYSGFPVAALQQRSRIICAYLQVLEKTRGPVAADDELPFPKEQIAEAILRELEYGSEYDSRRRLEIAYVLLETFIPADEYRIIEEFKAASLSAQLIAEMGDPTSILRSARIVRKVRGDSAVRLQEKIHEKMMERQLQIQEIANGNAA